LGTLFVLASLCASALAFAAAPAAKGKPAAGDKAAKIKKGEYLTTIMGCNDCHTPGTFYGAPDFDRKLSGSEIGWKGPWGVSFARNLTPDAETGIGYYSEDEIVHSFRTGIKPNGSPMLPPMPWPNFAAMSDEDLHAIAAYLLSLKPVKHAVPESVPPGQPWTGATIEIPAPPAWDAPRTPPPSPAGK
jgi:mono/diheme cytochrome c family protein